MSDHPDDIQLTSYLLGSLDDLQFDLVESHLEQCHECQARAIELNPRDGLVKLISTNSNEKSERKTDTSEHVDSVPPLEFDNHPRYRLIRPLGRGGMGIVWLAQHLVMDRLVAIKLIHTTWLSNSETAHRFHREVRAVSKLKHPNIVSTYDADRVDNHHFMVMEYIEGKTLAQAVRQGPISIQEACDSIREVARGLQHAHAAGIVHRDIKPGNLMYSVDGSVKILDFGIAFVSEDGEFTTASNMMVGTADYVSPEQAMHPGNADARSDIYSLGCTFYHLLSGNAPFPVNGVLAKLDAHRQSTPSPMSNVPPALQKIVSKMMARAPRDRFQTALEVEKAIIDFADRGKSIDYKPRFLSIALHRKAILRALAIGALVLLPSMVVFLYIIGWASKTDSPLDPIPSLLSELVKDSPMPFAETDPVLHQAADANTRRYSLKLPTAIAGGSQADYVTEEVGFTIDAISRASQIWLDYRYFVAKRIRLQMNVEFLEVRNPSFLKIAFLSDVDGEEYNVQFWPDSEGNIKRVRVELATRKPGSSPDLHLLSEATIDAGNARSDNHVEIALEKECIAVWLNQKWIVQCPYSAEKPRFLSIAAHQCRVQITSPTAIEYQ